MDKQEQKKLLIEVMQADEKNGLYKQQTAKEKALELVTKMKFQCIECDYEFNAKQCALIAVYEILYLLPEIAFRSRIYKYWQEVKQEIEKL